MDSGSGSSPPPPPLELGISSAPSHRWLWVLVASVVATAVVAVVAWAVAKGKVFELQCGVCSVDCDRAAPRATQAARQSLQFTEGKITECELQAANAQRWYDNEIARYRTMLRSQQAASGVALSMQILTCSQQIADCANTWTKTLSDCTAEKLTDGTTCTNAKKVQQDDLDTCTGKKTTDVAAAQAVCQTALDTCHSDSAIAVGNCTARNQVALALCQPLTSAAEADLQDCQQRLQAITAPSDPQGSTLMRQWDASVSRTLEIDSNGFVQAWYAVVALSEPDKWIDLKDSEPMPAWQADGSSDNVRPRYDTPRKGVAFTAGNDTLLAPSAVFGRIWGRTTYLLITLLAGGQSSDNGGDFLSNHEARSDNRHDDSGLRITIRQPWTLSMTVTDSRTNKGTGSQYFLGTLSRSRTGTFLNRHVITLGLDPVAGGSVQLGVDNNVDSITHGAAAKTVPVDLLLGKMPNGGAGAQFLCHEIRIYTGVHDEAQRSQVINQMKNKWDLL